MRVITLEEHDTTEAIAGESARIMGGSSRMVDQLKEKLLDLDSGRLAAMDAGRVDV